MAETIELPDPDDPADALAAVVALRRAAEQLALTAVRAALDAGWTWAQIGDALGVTPQAAHKRYARRVG